MSSHSGTSLIFYFLINIFNFSKYKSIYFLDEIDRFKILIINK